MCTEREDKRNCSQLILQESSWVRNICPVPFCLRFLWACFSMLLLLLFLINRSRVFVSHANTRWCVFVTPSRKHGSGRGEGSTKAALRSPRTFRSRAGGGGAAPCSRSRSQARSGQLCPLPLAHSSVSHHFQQEIETCHIAVISILNVPDYHKKKAEKRGISSKCKTWVVWAIILANKKKNATEGRGARD